MALQNRLNFNLTPKVVAHLDVDVWPTDWFDVSHVHHLRVVTSVTGVGAGSTGDLVINCYGRVKGFVTTIVVGTDTIVATGVTETVDGTFLLDVRGFEDIRLAFSYTNVPADSVTVTGVMTTPYPDPPY